MRDESFIETALNEMYEKARKENAVPWNDAFHEALEHPDAETQARLDREWEETFGDPHGEA